ncbi:uncharacterized protein LOC135103507 isoform X2 [Scylla paramamosain]|uniref:uncharacterized protein LOC135103507 isoform X2 n=1 Tax=Scylla paramamosain TaxID=85552 RepID=UPI0030827AA8
MQVPWTHLHLLQYHALPHLVCHHLYCHSQLQPNPSSRSGFSIPLSSTSATTSQPSPSAALPSSSLRPRALSSDSSSDSSTDSIGVVPAGDGSTHHTLGLSTPSTSVFPSLLSESGGLTLQEGLPSASSLLTGSLDSLPLDEFVEMPQETPESSSQLPPPSSASLQLPSAAVPEGESDCPVQSPSQQDITHRLENTAQGTFGSLLTSAPLTTDEEDTMEMHFISRDEERKGKREKNSPVRESTTCWVCRAQGSVTTCRPIPAGSKTWHFTCVLHCPVFGSQTEHRKFLHSQDSDSARGWGGESKMIGKARCYFTQSIPLLSLLSGQHGVIQHHGLFQDYAFGVREQGGSNSSGSSSGSGRSGGLVSTGNLVRRVCLVLDCVTPQDYCPHTADLINLQHYVITKKKLVERHALTIFYNIVSVVLSLHEQNVVHRDLKLGNLVLHRATHEIIITNFCLGQHLPSEKDRLRDQRGSPAYISPDVLSGKPYLGKPSDMWALGVVLFTMLYGHFPFYDVQPQELFRKIKAAQYTLPKGEKMVSEATKDVIRGLLVLDPNQRFTCKQVLTRLTTIVSGPIVENPQLLQVVPEMEKLDEEAQEREVKKVQPSKRASKLLACESVEHCFKNGSSVSARQKSSVETESENPAKYNIDYLLMQHVKQKRDEDNSHIGSSKTAGNIASSSSVSNSSISSSSGTSNIGGSSSSSRSSGVIPCLVGDARPLTTAQLSSFWHILPHSSRIGEAVNPCPKPPPPTTTSTTTPTIHTGTASSCSTTATLPTTTTFTQCCSSSHP